jgi:putative thiamine transport system ATP-binding protein
MKQVLRLQGVRLAIAGRTIIGPLSATVLPSECLTLMGPSGCGKSSLLAFMAGTLDPVFESQGQVTVGDTDLAPLPPEARRVGILFQDDLLFPHMNVRDNLLFAVPAGTRAARVQAAEHALDEAGLAGFCERMPGSLSGGQRSRVSLLRALLAEPAALLLDEPFGKLDTALREQMRQFTFAKLAARQVPVLLVTHDAADIPVGAQTLRLDDHA